MHPATSAIRDPRRTRSIVRTALLSHVRESSCSQTRTPTEQTPGAISVHCVAPWPANHATASHAICTATTLPVARSPVPFGPCQICAGSASYGYPAVAVHVSLSAHPSIKTRPEAFPHISSFASTLPLSIARTHPLDKKTEAQSQDPEPPYQPKPFPPASLSRHIRSIAPPAIRGTPSNCLLLRTIQLSRLRGDVAQIGPTNQPGQASPPAPSRRDPVPATSTHTHTPTTCAGSPEQKPVRA